MGLDVYSKIIIGVPVSRSDFVRAIGAGMKCARGHVAVGGLSAGPFCPQDGTPFKGTPIEEPTDIARAYAANYGSAAENAWEYARERHVWQCDATQTADDKAPNYVLGSEVRSCNSATPKDMSLNAAAIAKAMTEAEGLARAIGLVGTAKLYACVYLSY